MPVFVEDPAHLSKSRLKSDLVAHNVELPPGKSKKEVYVQLHLKHIDQKNAADFSSDEEDRVQDVADEREKPEDAEMPDPSGLTDDDLKAALLVHGVKAGPIVASTRALYERKLSKLLQSDGHYQLNGAEKGILYSDSEEEEENGEEEDAESGAEKEKQTVEQSDQGQQESSQVPSGSQLVMASSCSSSSSQTFSITEMVEEMESQRSLSTRTNTERELKWSNVQEHWSRSNRLDVPVVDKCTMTNQSVYYTPGASPHEWGMKLPQEPVKDTFKDIFSNAETTPTGIYATRRRPIKGAAGRPVQYAYPDTAVSPTTLERREVERRLVPILIQVLVFLIVVCVLYLIYVCLWDTSFSPFVALLDSLNQMSDSEEGLLLQTEVQDTPAPSGQE
ncbi:lamina-associated polypeptide 2, isoforms beta/gamma-like isoform X4 [Seriola lalandi dorsalis]|uniref:lamina-associated polypeptide 2, isoforms beta/gamma-like isoform X4 n=1 Tax=Seriola lalandi dorsalis TaxID=1841481 RepID=UPI000C6F8289|nr:lamina-associated polypeptide 2, isoforms beta/gamma-like isoform X4 [Seriola lalandi dorsalis]XP_056240183.1 LEM domain-containing protein 1 isoform X5 [Seriola aureovittata]